jgi:hypothetical protein
MRSRLTVVLVLLLLLAAGQIGAEKKERVTGQYEIDLLNPDDCPVTILEKKTRVADPNRYDAWATTRSSDPSTYARRSYEAGERQMIYDVAFRNVSRSDIDEIDFLWEAFNSSKQPSFIFRSSYDAKTLRPGEVQFKHEVDFKHSAAVDTYRLSVRRVTFADGTVWVAPQLTYD